MIHNSTCRALTARVGTRINTLVILTSTIRRAIRANCTFGSATGWCTDISRQARANSLPIAYPALTIRSARGWLTRIDIICYNRWKKVRYLKPHNCLYGRRARVFKKFLTGFDDKTAKYEWISRVSLEASASWCMINHVALSVLAACSWTRIFAFQINTRLIGRTIGIECTLGSAPFIRIADIIGRAWARTSILLNSAYCICTTWRWCARRGYARLYID